METFCTLASILGTSSSAVQTQRTSPRTGAIPKNPRGTKEQMKHQDQGKPLTQQSSASTEKQDCLVQSQRTSSITGAIPKNTMGRKAQTKPKSQTQAKTQLGASVHLSEEPKPHHSASVHLPEEPKPHQSSLVHLPEEPKPHQSASVHLPEEPKPHQSASVHLSEEPNSHQSASDHLPEEPKPHQSAPVHLPEEPNSHQSASDHLPEEPKPHQSASDHLPEEPKPHQSASDHLPEEPNSHQSASVQLPEEPKPHQSASDQLPEEPKPHQSASDQLPEEPKPHQSASVHLPEEPILHQSVPSTAGTIDEIASNCDSKDIVPAVHQDLATRSQSSDALTLVHHQSQAMVKNMSIGEGCKVFMAPASGNTFIQHQTVMPPPNLQAQAIAEVIGEVLKRVDMTTGVAHSNPPTQARAFADVTREALKQVDMTTGTPDPSHQPQAISDELTEALKQVYMNTGSFVQMLPWVDDDQMHIMDIYTKLVLVVLNDKVGKIVKEKKLQMESYGDIFHLKTREGNPIKRVIFSGSAGLGKTTLCDKIAYDWAVGKSEILKRFKLVLVLKMRSLTTATDLIDAVADQLIERDIVKRCDLKGFIDKNQDKVLILLDGFDEFQTTQTEKSSFGSILKALNRKQYKECWVVVTSRPPLDQLLSSSLVEKPFTHVEVEGFSAEDIEEYVNKFFPDDLENVGKLIEKIQSSEVLSDLAKSPMLLLLMCLLWRESKKLPDTMTRLYTAALKYIFRRKAKDLSQDEISQILISIGKVALHGLISTNQSLSFREKDFDKKAFDAAIRAGALTSERVFKELDAHNNVYFIHKTFLEFCAAMYWQSLINTEEFYDILVRLCSATGSYPSPYEYLLRFCCGDNEECTNQVLQNLQKNEDPRLGLICYFESQSKSLPYEDFINAVVRTKIRIHVWNSDCVNSFFHLVKQIANQKNIQESASLSSVNKFVIINCDLRRLGIGLENILKLELISSNVGGSASLWASHLKIMKRLNNLTLSICKLVGEDMAPIAESVSDMPALVDLDLSLNKTLGCCASLWASHLKRMKRLNNLTLSICKLVGEDMAPIAESVSDMPALVDLDLSSHRTLGGCASLWATQLKRMKHLKNLRLAYCGLTVKDMAPIAESVSDMPTLVDLNLSLNETLGGCASLWATQLKRMKHLKNLTLANCGLTVKDMVPIAESVSDMPALVDLDLSSNKTLGGCASWWATQLKRMKHLKNLDMAPIAESVSDMPALIDLLDLSSNKTLGGCASLWATQLKRMKHLKNLRLENCGLTVKDMVPIAESVSDMPTLVDLDLSSNKTLGGCASLWATQLKRMKHLKNLRLENCGLTVKDMAPIAESVSDMPALVDLDLSSNKTLGGCASLWATQLKRMKHLKNLRLENCGLTVKDMAPIAESVSDMPALIDLLDLSSNKTLGGCASLWATQLKRMKHLKNLRLENCGLTVKDMVPIAESVSDMPTLVDLDLSENETLGGCASLWASHLKRMKHLKNLAFASCNLMGKDMAPIAESVSDMPTLVDLDLSLNMTLGGCASLWATHLKRMKHLKNLRLAYCNLMGKDMAPIAESVSDMPTLVDLDLSQNKTLGGCASLWASHLKRMKHLKNLAFASCNLMGKDMAPIAESVSDMPTLVDLDLSLNMTLGGCASLWATHLKRMKHLKNLSLAYCNLMGKDMAPIAESVSDMPTLVKLDLSLNTTLSGCASLWATHLKRMKHLKNLRLAYCNLMGKDMAPIAESVSDMPTLVKLDLSSNTTLSGCASLWATHLKRMKHLKNLRLAYCNLMGKDMAPIAESVSDMPTLVDLNLSLNMTLGGCASLWATHLKRMKHLKNLRLVYCNLMGKDMAPIAESVSDMPTLVDLDLSANMTFGGCASLWATHLKRMKHLKNLRLAYCNLMGIDMAPIAESVSDMPTLVDLDLSLNMTLGGCASLWATHLKRMKHLKNLRLAYCNLMGKDMAPIAESVSDMPTLVDLDLSQNKTLGGCASLWASHLKRMKHLKNLAFASCNLMGKDMAPIAESVSDMPTLVDLDLSLNMTLGGCASLWATHLKRMKHLKNLSLAYCNLMGKDMAPIAESVSDMPTLVDLDLSENKTLGGCATLWASHLKRMKHLKNLAFASCNLMGKDMAPIAESVSDMPTLVDLDLSLNMTLGGCASLWATHLKRMKHLKNLRLAYCNLMGKDMAPIAESVSDMPTLVDLDLSKNKTLGGCASLWASHLKRMKHLKNLAFASCNLIGKDMAPIAESVSDMPTLVDLDLSLNMTLGGCASLWATHLKRMKHLKNLRLAYCNLMGKDMAPIAESVSDMPTLVDLDLSKNKTLGGCASLWASHLKRMKHLKNLAFASCNLIGKDMAPIAESVSDMPTLVDLDLSLNMTLGGCASLWATHLKRMKHLKNLSLAYCNLMGKDMAPIAESVSDMPTLVDLDLSKNKTLGGCASLWASHLKRMKHLKNLAFASCNLMGKDMAPIAESVSDMPTLVDLNLSLNMTLGGCASLWATHLKRMKHLKNLRLVYCNLMGKDMAPIAESVSDMPTLVDLDLSANMTFGGCASLWATHLKRMKHLKNLRLAYCNLMGKDMAPIAESVSDMPTLVDLDLSKNKTLGGCASLWASHLKRMKHLKNLAFASCNLMGKDMAPIAESVSDMPTLVDLDLSLNMTLGGCASLWATHLKRMKHLKNLRLTNCKLMGEDVAPIAESVSDMPTLVDLDLSLNMTLGGCASLWATHLKRMKHLKNLRLTNCKLMGEDVAPIAESVSDMPTLVDLSLFNNYNLGGCASLWATHLKRMKHLKNLSLAYCNLMGKDMAPIAESVSDMPTLVDLNLSLNMTLGGCASLWATHLKRMKHLKNLRLVYCNLMGKDMAPIAESVSDMPTLVDLDLSANMTFGGCASLWATHLKRMKHLKNLRLAYCNLMGKDMAPIAESVSDMPTLVDLDLSKNKTLGGCASLWASHLKRMKHLKNLAFASCNLMGKDMAPIAESVSDMPTLVDLDLSLNMTLGGCASLWATHLKRMKHLKNLRLTNCKLMGEDVAPIAESVSDMPTLVDLDLSLNMTLGGCASLWATHLKRMKHLKNLRLTNCKLMGEDVAPIAESVSDMPTLVDLSLFNNYNLGGCASLWATHLKRMKHLKNLSLAYCNLMGKDMAPIAESVSDMPTLVDLDLSKNKTLGGCASLWASHLKRMKHLKNLAFASCNLIGKDMAPIAESVSDMPTLVDLDLSLNMTLGGCASLWATHLKRMKHLKNLRLAYCNLMGKDMAPIAESVSDMPTLVDLDLSKNKTLGGCASLWASHLKRMKHLKNLAFASCNLIGKDMAPIAESVSDMPTLVDLDLSLNMTLGGCASLWATHLKRMKHLKNLSLAYCNLMGKDMAPIAESVSDMPTLVDLDLSKNKTLGGCASLWASHLKRMKHLKNLAFASCNLMGKDMAPIAESVSDMPTLVDLNLSLNMTLGGCASLWATHLKRMKHLKNLRLVYCNLMGKDMAPIAESVSDMPTLVDLDLSANMTFGGCASLWATHLKRMKHLKNLRLAYCNLMGKDMAPIAESVSDMPTLVDLDLSKNKTLGGCASLWASHLKRMKHLKNLAFASCNLMGKDMAPIAESVSDMPTLVDLDLSLNMTLGGCASLWATHLKRMKHLKNLRLTNCKLMGEDVAPIAESVSDMPTLVDLDLSLNMTLGGCASLWATHLKRMKHLKNLRLTNCKLMGEDVAPIAESVSDMPTLVDLSLFNNYNLGGCASLWATHLKRMKHLKNLSLAYCNLMGKDMAPIAESVSDMPTLVDLNLSLNMTLGGCASLWATHLKRMKHLKNLRLVYCNLMGKDMAPIAESVSDMPTLVDLDLSANMTFGGCASLWATHLKRMKHLKNLRLAYCNLMGKDMAPIAESVSDMPTLVDLDLSKNKTLGGCASLWASHLKRMKHLKNLAFASCNLMGKDMAPIAESVSDMPTLVDLDLSLNMTLGGCASLWATHLKRMKHLKNLRLTNCKLMGEDVAPIAESVSDMPTLVDLDLSLNMTLGGCASLWATHLKRMKHLKNLRLTNCKLMGEDVAPIAESVSDMPTLVDLSLFNNYNLGGCASLWATHLKRMKHLKNLSLAYCNLMGKDMAPIAESVSDMPTLVDLSLFNNDTLGGCASLWATHLKRMKHLKNLSLAYCNLMGKDMAPIAESVSDMPTLVKLDLSSNTTLSGCASLWATHLKRMKHLKNLRLAYCNLMGKDMAPIAESMSDMPNLSDLNLRGNEALGVCASLWPTQLKRMKHLKNLRLSGVELTEKNRRLINDALKDITTLDVEMD
ncbi:uncharacterized protein LOC117305486 [Asterias rubens]|uniref:uncharacterized protein LOC117305486 n=2 Tax=Asterias rubens TaxID=7604 RepID=UPI0014553C9A|nr:uncharacterized protein LOC117305486 [Asterias rubens]